MTETLASMLDSAPRRDATEPPAWFLQTTKEQCAALPLPLRITVHHNAVTLVYRDGLLVERYVSSTHEGAPQSPYTLYIPYTHRVEYDLPEDAAELADQIK